MLFKDVKNISINNNSLLKTQYFTIMQSKLNIISLYNYWINPFIEIQLKITSNFHKQRYSE